MITRGAADGDAQDGSFLTDSVVVVQGLLSGGGLGGPQLMEITEGLRTESWTAARKASRNPSSVFGAK